MPETHRYVSIEEAQNSTEWGNSYYGPIDNTRTFAAFVQTAWSQVNPYNNKVPQYCNNNGVTERCRVGCFAVALGQLMSYHKHPISYNWDLLISTPSISPYHTSAVNEVSRLLYDLALSGGTEYKLTGAGSTSVSKITPTLNSFGYNVTSTYLGTGQSSHISIEELKASRPVLFVAESTRGGHIWVIDGIFEFERWYYFPARIMPTESPSGIEIRRVRTMRRLSHCNWGWGGLSNGWYYNYTPKYTDGSYIKFNTQKWLYTGIVPK